MADHSWPNGDRNHHNPYLGNSTTSPESSEMKHQSGIAMYWSSEEQAILEDGLVRYSSEPSISRYAKIASELQNNKTVRDVAMRCRWISRKENKKRRKEDHNGSGRARVDNKEIIDMVVASNSVPHQFAPSHLLREEEVITNELLKQNDHFLNQISANLTHLNHISANLKNLHQISANLTSSRLTENLTLFYKSRENIKKLLNNLKENAPEPMKHMPQFPEKLSDDYDELLDSILTSSILPKLP